MDKAKNFSILRNVLKMTGTLKHRCTKLVLMIKEDMMEANAKLLLNQMKGIFKIYFKNIYILYYYP